MLVSQATRAAAPDKKSNKTYEDDDYGFKVSYPGGDWKRGYPGIIFVPGELCRVWSSGPTNSIAVFVQKPGGPVPPRFLLEQSAESLKSTHSARVVKQEIRKVGGMQAMSLIVTANGTGAALENTGTVPTSQHWIAIPREDDIVVLLLTASDSEFKSASKVFEDMLKSLKLEGKQTDEQKDSK
jgi:hypothetical protein